MKRHCASRPSYMRTAVFFRHCLKHQFVHLPQPGLPRMNLRDLIVVPLLATSPLPRFDSLLTLGWFRKSDYGEGTLYWALVKQTGSNKRLGKHGIRDTSQVLQCIGHSNQFHLLNVIIRIVKQSIEQLVANYQPIIGYGHGSTNII